jgi:hypothetical protein
MQDAGGVVHGAIGIDSDREALLTEAGPDTVGKARAHEEHPFTRFNPKPRLWDIHYRPKLHLLALNYILS